MAGNGEERSGDYSVQLLAAVCVSKSID
jgi:hypothetical protein